MRVIVCQRPDSATPYDHWIAQLAPGAEIVVLTARSTVRREPDLAPGARLVLVDDYESEEYVEALSGLARGAARIVANSETDTLRVAQVRTLHGIPGLHEDLALRFRDKVAMKPLFADLPTPPVPFLVPRDVDDVVHGVATFGTAVLKPRDGVGSAGVHVLRDAQEARSLLEARPQLTAAVRARTLILEKFMAGDVFHVDALIERDRVLLCSPSRYLSPPHQFDRHNTRSHMLEPSPLRDRLAQTTAALAAALPEGHGVGAVHLELLADEHGVLHAGEVAARVGGALIKDGVQHTYGVDLSRAVATLELGRTVTVPRRRGPLTGWVLRTGGPPLQIPDPAPAWVVSHRVDEPGEGAHDGHETTAPADSCDATARALVGGPTQDAVIRRLAALQASTPLTTTTGSPR